MKNREQIRARNALEAVKNLNAGGAKGGNALSGFPALVMNNGLMAALAFSKDKKHGYEQICDAIARHLADPEIALLPPDRATLDGMLNGLAGDDSIRLRLCTAEALAYLSFLKRFAKTETTDK